MVSVVLEQDWTDTHGTAYRAGETVDVTAGTLAALEAAGAVAEHGGGDDGGGDGGDPDEGGDSWIEPTGGDGTESWIEPTDDDD